MDFCIEVSRVIGHRFRNGILLLFQRRIEQRSGTIPYQRITHPANTLQNFEDDPQEIQVFKCFIICKWVMWRWSHHRILNAQLYNACKWEGLITRGFILDEALHNFDYCHANDSKYLMSPPFSRSFF